jgi:glycosyltransferase involved in cell wall biosynthesis
VSVPQRLRILQVILSRGFAGSERAAAEMCSALATQHQVAIAIRADHRSAGGASIRDFLDDRVEVIELPPYWGTQRRLDRLIKSWRPDIVHTHLRRGTRLASRCRAGVAGVGSVHIAINGRHYLRTDALFCISDWQLPTVPVSYRGRVYLLPNTLLPEPRLGPGERQAVRAELGADPGDCLVGSVGRLSRSKGLDVLLRAFEAADLPRARLIIVGEGRERSRLERLAGPHVLFLGYRRDARRLMQAFDLFVCPSRVEPFGRVIVEALDAGVPVIASDAAGPRDIARRLPIEIVPRGDAGSLAAALQRAVADGRRRADCDLAEFGITQLTARLVSAYREVLGAEGTANAGRADASDGLPREPAGHWDARRGFG